MDFFFFAALEEEVTKAELAGKSIMICFDVNSKLRPVDPQDQSENGKLVECIRERYALTVANVIQEKSHSLITRERITADGTEKSVIDLVECLKGIVIDEENSFDLESLKKKKKKSIIFKNKLL